MLFYLLLFDVLEFVSETRLLHDCFVNKGRLVCFNLYFFQRRTFLKSTVDSFFLFFIRTVFPTKAELKKRFSEIIDKSFI